MFSLGYAFNEATGKLEVANGLRSIIIRWSKGIRLGGYLECYR